MSSDTLIEDWRGELATEIQNLITYDPGGGNVLEATVVHEFQDKEEIYPCIVIDIGTGDSPPRHLGTVDSQVVSAEIQILSLRPTLNSHIITCEDTIKRSGRKLVEYLAMKIGNHLKRYEPTLQVELSDVDILLNTDFEERDGVFKSTVIYEIMV